MEYIDDRFALDYPRSKKGKREYLAFYLILFVAFPLLLAFYAIETKTITEIRSSDGDGCTRQSLSSNYGINGIQNFPGDVECSSHVNSTAASSDLTVFNFKTSALPLDTSCATGQSAYQFTMYFSYSVFGGTSFSQQAGFTLCSATDLSTDTVTAIYSCTGTESVKTTPCCQGGAAFVQDNGNGASWTVCPTAEQVSNVGTYMANYIYSGQALAGDIENQGNNAQIHAKTVLCVIRDEALSVYSCKVEVEHSPLDLFIIAVTLFYTISGYLMYWFEIFFAPEDEEDTAAVPPVQKNEVELKM